MAGYRLCPRCSLDWNILNNMLREGGVDAGVACLLIANCPACWQEFKAWRKTPYPVEVVR